MVSGYKFTHFYLFLNLKIKTLNTLFFVFCLFKKKIQVKNDFSYFYKNCIVFFLNKFQKIFKKTKVFPNIFCEKYYLISKIKIHHKEVAGWYFIPLMFNKEGLFILNPVSLTPISLVFGLEKFFATYCKNPNLIKKCLSFSFELIDKKKSTKDGNVLILHLKSVFLNSIALVIQKRKFVKIQSKIFLNNKNLALRILFQNKKLFEKKKKLRSLHDIKLNVIRKYLFKNTLTKFSENLNNNLHTKESIKSFEIYSHYFYIVNNSLNSNHFSYVLEIFKTLDSHAIFLTYNWGKQTITSPYVSFDRRFFLNFFDHRSRVFGFFGHILSFWKSLKVRDLFLWTIYGMIGAMSFFGSGTINKIKNKFEVYFFFNYFFYLFSFSIKFHLFFNNIYLTKKGSQIF